MARPVGLKRGAIDKKSAVYASRWGGKETTREDEGSVERATVREPNSLPRQKRRSRQGQSKAKLQRIRRAGKLSLRLFSSFLIIHLLPSFQRVIYNTAHLMR